MLLPDLYILNTLLVVLVYVMISVIIRHSLQTLREVKSLNQFFFVSNV